MMMTREDENKEYDAVFFWTEGGGRGGLNMCDEKCESGYYSFNDWSSF